MNQLATQALPAPPPMAMQPTGETASAFAAATAKATVEARYLMALRTPRNWDQVRRDMLHECKRPSFARNKSTWYRKPIGGQGVEGFGIRFAEMAARCLRNLMVESVLVFEDAEKEVHRLIVTDLDANNTFPEDYKVSKTVERSKPRDDGSYISTRLNSQGKITYTVPAEDEDLLNKRGALKSKAMRNVLLRIVPGDILDECKASIMHVRGDAAASDPDGERKALADEFASVGVTPMMLAEYLGHDLAQCSPAQLVSLRDLYSAIAEGEASWRQAMENKAEGKPTPGKKEAREVWPADKFAVELKRWAKAVELLIKTPDDILILAEKRGDLTPEQRATIAALQPGAGGAGDSADKSATNGAVDGATTQATDATTTTDGGAQQ